MATNDQYLPGQTPFGMSPGIASTGAGGNPTALPSLDSADLATGVVVSEPFESSQVAPDTATVHIGDTATPSYGPIPPDGDPLTGLPTSFLTDTGAGQGNTHTTHPGARP